MGHLCRLNEDHRNYYEPQSHGRLAEPLARGIVVFIDQLIRLLLPRQDQFFALLEQIAVKITAAAEVFGELATASHHGQFEQIAGRLKPIETEADELCHRLYEELDRTFVTPIDREDLAHLTKALDNVIDAMEHVAAFADLFRFESLSEPMQQMVRITVKTAMEVVGAIGNLRKFNDPESIRGRTVTVHTLENEADAVYRAAVETLFTNGVDARELVRQKDMLISLEMGVDQCEDAMDVIRSIVVKHG
jgi:predicted phosphate transport protein (TIGR00153 family)